MLTISLLLVLIALFGSIAAGIGKAPLWPFVLVLALAHLMTLVPIR